VCTPCVCVYPVCVYPVYRTFGVRAPGWMVVATDGGVECATPARPTDAMSAVEIVPETQKHPFAVMLMLGFKASPIVAYV